MNVKCRPLAFIWYGVYKKTKAGLELVSLHHSAWLLMVYFSTDQISLSDCLYFVTECLTLFPSWYFDPYLRLWGGVICACGVVVKLPPFPYFFLNWRMFNTWNLPQLSCTWTTLKKIKIKLYCLHNFLLTSTRQQRYHNLNIIAFLTIKLYKNMANVFKLKVKKYQSRSKRGLKENKKKYKWMGGGG